MSAKLTEGKRAIGECTLSRGDGLGWVQWVVPGGLVWGRAGFPLC